MAPPSEHTARVAARLDGAVALDLAVQAATEVYPGILELRLAGELAGFAPWPGQDLMVSVPPGASAPRFRRYTVRRFDPGAGTVDLWVTTTTDGPGAAWAIGARPGDRVDAVGPRGKIAVRDDVRVHLFVVDDAGLAAKCAMAEAIAAPAEVLSFSVLVPSPETLPGPEIEPRYNDGVRATIHVLDPADLGWVATVLEMSTTSLDRASVAAYVFGELALTRAVAAKLTSIGFDAALMAVKPYWREDRANEPNGEPDRDA
jgi:NADPH-dependent ferric siderophore reductase